MGFCASGSAITLPLASTPAPTKDDAICWLRRAAAWALPDESLDPAESPDVATFVFPLLLPATFVAASATKVTPCGELKLKPGALFDDRTGVKAPDVGSTCPNAFRLPTEA